MPAEKKTGPWTAVIQGEGSYDTATEEDVDNHIERFTRNLEADGHRIHSVRLSVGNEREYKDGTWQHAHSAPERVSSNDSDL